MTSSEFAAVHGPGRVLRVVSGYAVEWGYRYPDGVYGNDFANQFAFRPGAFNASLARGGDIALTQDLNGVPFARTGDSTLRITSDAVGLLVEADLLDNPLNRGLCNLIDAGRVKGWSHNFLARAGGYRIRDVDGVKLTEIHRAELLELTLVIKKRPRQRVRSTPIFLEALAFAKHCCCEPLICNECAEPPEQTSLTLEILSTCTDWDGVSFNLPWNGGLGGFHGTTTVGNWDFSATASDTGCSLDLIISDNAGGCTPTAHLYSFGFTEVLGCAPAFEAEGTDNVGDTGGCAGCLGSGDTITVRLTQ